MLRRVERSAASTGPENGFPVVKMRAVVVSDRVAEVVVESGSRQRFSYTCRHSGVVIGYVARHFREHQKVRQNPARAAARAIPPASASTDTRDQT